MRTVKAAAVVLLFVLIPHQAPLAEPAMSAVDETSASARVESESSNSQPQSAAEAAVPSGDRLAAGTESATPGAKDPNRRSRRTVDTDGYSLSARSLR